VGHVEMAQISIVNYTNSMKFNFKNAQNRGTLPKTVGHVEMAQISIVNKINQ
jgi:hypothetical protein